MKDDIKKLNGIIGKYGIIIAVKINKKSKVKLVIMKKCLFNKITDVEGVTVGHHTIDKDDIKTGVTVINPSLDNPYISKLQAASYVINGYGKTTGLLQIDEMGLLESPIALTNTLSVGMVSDALVGHVIESSEGMGKKPKTINVVVGECNDSRLNNITNRVVSKEHVNLAFKDAREDFELGSVGAGKGMVCYGLKGGIGSSSRIVEYEDATYKVGALVLANHGLLHQLVIEGKRVGEELYSRFKAKKDNEIEQGSIVVIIATDAPVDSRQLKRISKRACAGIARTGSEFGNGSGDIVISFSTKNKIQHIFEQGNSVKLNTFEFLDDSVIDRLFAGAIEAVEESIYSALYSAKTEGEYKCLNEIYTK